MCQRQKRPANDLGFFSYLALNEQFSHFCSIIMRIGYILLQDVLILKLLDGMIHPAILDKDRSFGDTVCK